MTRDCPDHSLGDLLDARTHHYAILVYVVSVGLPAKQGSIVGAVVNAGQMVGRTLMDLASDKVGRVNVATSSKSTCGLF